MIKSIDLHNFQSHKESHLDLCPGVNVLIGSSDSGKSAIIRLLRWVMQNRPNTDSFRSWWGGETSGVLHLPEGRVSRIKSSKFNRYVIETSKDDELVFDAVKTDIPEEVVKILNIEDANLQRQFARSFLLDSSPGEVAQHFNRVANLDKIDSSNKNVQTWLRSIQGDIEAKKDQLEEFQEELKRYEGLEELEGRLTELETVQKEVNNKTASKTMIEKLVYEIRIADLEISRQDKLLELEPEVTRIQACMDLRNTTLYDKEALRNKIINWNTLTEQIDQLDLLLNVEPEVTRIQGLIEQRKNTEADRDLLRGKITQASEVTQQIDQIDVFLSVDSDVVQVLDWIKRRDKIQEHATEIRDILRTIRGTDQDIERSVEWLDQAQKEFYDEFPEECPLCGKPK